MSDNRTFRTVEEIISAKMEQRFTIGGISQDDCDLLDEFLGTDHSVSPLPGISSLRRGRGEPSGGDRTLRVAETSPPTTNRGVTKHVRANESVPPPTAFGGYDSPFEIGFEVEWDSSKFSSIKSSLQSGKELASESESGTALIEIGGHTVSIDACGANVGMHYRYKFQLNGVTFFLHHNCPKGRRVFASATARWH